VSSSTSFSSLLFAAWRAPVSLAACRHIRRVNEILANKTALGNHKQWGNFEQIGNLRDGIWVEQRLNYADLCYPSSSACKQGKINGFRN
jgi:hypothetical protein